MVASIARQSVILKCIRQKSIMLGNYEFYYAAGLLSALSKIDIETGLSPVVLKEKTDAILKQFTPADDREKHLVKMLTYYHPEETENEQTAELFLMGKNEQKIWVENP